MLTKSNFMQPTHRQLLDNNIFYLLSNCQELFQFSGQHSSSAHHASSYQQILRAAIKSGKNCFDNFMRFTSAFEIQKFEYKKISGPLPKFFAPLSTHKVAKFKNFFEICLKWQINQRGNFS